MQLRKLALTFHQVAGITVGFLLLVIGISGSGLAFWQEIDYAITPEYQRVSSSSAISLDRVLAQAAKAHDSKEPLLGILVFKGNVHTPIYMTPQKQYRQVFVEPRSYQVVGSRIFQESLVGWLHTLHTQLFAGDFGFNAVGVIGLLLVVMSLTGLVLWPGWNAPSAGFSLRWQSPLPILSYDLHKVTGLFVFIFLLVQGLTGAALVFNQPFKKAAFWLSGISEPAPVVSRVVPGRQPLALDALMATANHVVSGVHLHGVIVSPMPEGAVQIFYEAEGAAGLHVEVSLDRYSGKVLRVEDARKPASGVALVLAWLEPLHFGTFGGSATQALYLVLGLAPGGLFLTGFYLWFNKLKKKLARQTAPQASS
ncbi:MAG: PepSY domain-containing protein [Anaerolineae bacterium]|nr:PepSY domain-containing protein [Gloeobacterales cyanobacterium ES-bin-313]